MASPCCHLSGTLKVDKKVWDWPLYPNGLHKLLMDRLDVNQQLALADLIALMDGQRRHDPVKWGDNRVLHLHCFEDKELLAQYHLMSLFHKNLDN